MVVFGEPEVFEHDLLRLVHREIWNDRPKRQEVLDFDLKYGVLRVRNSLHSAEITVQYASQ